METEFETLSEEVIEERKRPRKYKGLVLFATLIIIFAGLLFWLTQTFFLVDIDGRSMQPTLYDGETVLCNKTAKAKAGDVVVISGESENGYIIKRVIAVAGQTVQIIEGRVYVDGVAIEEPYIKDQTFDFDGKWSEPRVVKENEIFYLGDNRPISKDSRSKSFDTCLVEQIVGVVPEWAITVKPLTSFFF